MNGVRRITGKHGQVKLETVSGGGLKPGVDLDNSRGLRGIMDGH
jgi:hypothetical protein